MTDTSKTPDPDWWSVDETPSIPQRDTEFTEAAAHMRDAAEYLRDMSAPTAPPKESNWDWSWVKNWIRDHPNGKACKRAIYTTGPVFALVLWRYSHDTGNNAGSAAFFFFLLTGIAHLWLKRPFTRLAVWGAAMAPVFYFPALVSAIFGLAEILVGGN